MDKLTEVLLTVWALSQENYTGPISHAIPARLMPTLRKARKEEFVYLDKKYGIYLEEAGSAHLTREGYTSLGHIYTSLGHIIP